jgi:anti-sigma28 factor (negative regulator of flagellin synthesis)
VKFHFLSRKKTEPSSSGNNQRTGCPVSENHIGAAHISDSESASAAFSGTPLPHSSDSVEEGAEDRAELVARLRQEIRDGTYEIPVAQLVKALTALLLRRR